MNKQEAFEALREAQMEELNMRTEVDNARQEVERLEYYLVQAKHRLKVAEKMFLQSSETK